MVSSPRSPSSPQKRGLSSPLSSSKSRHSDNDARGMPSPGSQSKQPASTKTIRLHPLSSEHEQPEPETDPEFNISAFVEGREKGMSPRRRHAMGLTDEISIKTERRMMEYFLKYAKFGADRGKLSGVGMRGETMDFNEFLACVTDLGFLKLERHGHSRHQHSSQEASHHVGVDKTFLAELFVAIKADAKEHKHELEFADFRVAMCTISVSLKKTLEKMIFPASTAAAEKKQAEENAKQEEQAREQARTLLGLQELKQEHMAALRVIFEEHGGDMDMSEFRTTFGPLLGLNGEEANTLFMRIDADTDGAISWDEFATYVIALGNPTIDRDGDVVLAEQIISDTDAHQHHDSTIAVAAFAASNRWRPEGDKYLTCTPDGTIRLWYGSSGNAIRHDVVMQGPSALVHCMCAMERYSMFVVASNDERMRFFSFDPRFRLELEYKTHECQAMACASFAYLQDGKEWTSYVVWGDDRGRLHFLLEDDVMAGRRSGGAVGELDAEAMRKANPQHNYSPKAFFSGWVTAIQFVPGLSLAGLVVASANDGSLITYDPDQRAVVTRFEGHSLAVKTFSWCQASKCVASGGLDRDILMWDPKTGRKLGKLLGHKAAVKDMAYYGRNDNLFSLDMRHTIIIWDLGKQIQMKMLKTDIDGPLKVREAARAGVLLVNERRGLFVLCAKHPKLWRIRSMEASGASGSNHSHPLVAALYNSAFHQLVTVDRHGLACVWEMDSGEQHFKFFVDTKVDDGLHVDPTCACFDNMHRKLLVGFSNGAVHSYNFNNGVQLNLFATESQSSIVAVSMSPNERRGSRELKNLIFAIGLESSIYYWKGSGHAPGARVLPYRKMHLPPWRKDWGVDMVSMSYHRTGMVATGRRDGQVLLWNAMTGFFKRDLDSSLFRKMDVDHTGLLDYAEVADFLRQRERYSEQEIKEFFERADADGGGTISKEEFIQAVQKRGTLERLDPETGKAIYARREYYVEATWFMRRTELLLCAFADGWVTFMDWNGKGDVASFSALPGPDAEHALLTCVTMDDQEEVLFIGDSEGNVNVWDIRSVSLSHRPSHRKMTIERVAGWQAHNSGGVVGLQWVARGAMVLTCGGSAEGEASLWTSEGDLLGSIGGEEKAPWSVPSDQQEKMLVVLKNAAEAKQQEMAQGGKRGAETASEGVEAAAVFEQLSGHRERKAASTRMKKFRLEKESSEGATLRAAAKVVLNKNWMRLQVAREEELQQRMKRAEWFFRLHLPAHRELTDFLKEKMEEVWWDKLNRMTFDDLHQGARNRIRRHPHWEDLHGEQRLRSLVQDFSTSLKGQDLVVPPREELVLSAYKYVCDRTRGKLSAHASWAQAGSFASGGADVASMASLGRQGTSTSLANRSPPPRAPAIRETSVPVFARESSMASVVSSSASSEWVGGNQSVMSSVSKESLSSFAGEARWKKEAQEPSAEAMVRGMLTVEIVQRRVENGRESEIGSHASDDEREAEEANLKFEAQHGWYPSWEGPVVTRAQRQRCEKVTSKVREILGDKKSGAGASGLRGGGGDSLPREREHARGAAAGVVSSFTGKPTTSSSILSLAGHGMPQRSVGPLTARRLSSRHLETEKRRRWDGVMVEQKQEAAGGRRRGSREGAVEGDHSWMTLHVHAVAEVVRSPRLRTLDVGVDGRGRAGPQRQQQPIDRRLSTTDDEPPQQPATARPRLETASGADEKGGRPRGEAQGVLSVHGAAGKTSAESGGGDHPGKRASVSGGHAKGGGQRDPRRVSPREGTSRDKAGSAQGGALPLPLAETGGAQGGGAKEGQHSLALSLDKLLIPSPSPPQPRPASTRSSNTPSSPRQRARVLAAASAVSLSVSHRSRSNSPADTPSPLLHSHSPARDPLRSDTAHPDTPPLPSALRLRSSVRPEDPATDARGPVTPLRAVSSAVNADRAPTPLLHPPPRTPNRDPALLRLHANDPALLPRRTTAPGPANELHGPLLRRDSMHHLIPSSSAPNGPQSRHTKETPQPLSGRIWNNPYEGSADQGHLCDSARRMSIPHLPSGSTGGPVSSTPPTEPAITLFSQLWEGVGADLSSVRWRESIVHLQGAALFATPATTGLWQEQEPATMLCLLGCRSEVFALSDLDSERIRPNAIALSFIAPGQEMSGEGSRDPQQETQEKASPTAPLAPSKSEPEPEPSRMLFLAAKDWQDALKWLQVLERTICQLRRHRRAEAEGRLTATEGIKQRSLMLRRIAKAETRSVHRHKLRLQQRSQGSRDPAHSGGVRQISFEETKVEGADEERSPLLIAGPSRFLGDD